MQQASKNGDKIPETKYSSCNPAGVAYNSVQEESINRLLAPVLLGLLILVFLTGDVFATEELVTFFVHNATRWKIDKIYILDNIPRAQKPPTLGDNRWGTDLTGASMISPGWGTTGFQLRVKTGMYVMVVFEKAGLGGPANNRTRWFYFEDNSQSYKWTVKDDPAQDTVVGTPNSSGSGPTPQQRRDLSQVR